ncbi:hypothetical protein OG884_09190 [Streptosporangium sp. NBC_01755]|uniref:hypothetical protein n=1 Tax=unclassified Streptosporangium TaxID=2632669 RepID=UPI002DD9DC45|nr:MULTISPECIES: hypothetical protein [unclassified Streptosporangium]WSA26511.1 hypothetical protein OIE13_00960 [Streptosporangium sp. NBC_01810]WSD02066.1 hypothetical protein OG884_09190 [Streptosporangium sp. NBC_01755]
MNAAPKRGDASVSRRGGLPSPVHAAAPPTAARLRAEELVVELDRAHGISADIHELRSGNAIVSVYRGLLAYSDGENFWWTSPELDGSGEHLLSAASGPATAAERLAEHYEILRARPLTTLLGCELPLLADVILAEHVDPC